VVKRRMKSLTGGWRVLQDDGEFNRRMESLAEGWRG
jgi:hypothetical protein